MAVTIADMARSTFLAVALLACFACTPAKRVVQPERDQVAFFERPVALAAARKSGIPVPVIVALKSDPWAMVIGSDSPTFAMYEDGTVIRRSGDGYISSHLTRSEQVDLLNLLKPTSLRRWYGRLIALPGVTDQPEQDLLFYAGGLPIFVSVYGSLDTAAVRSVIPQEVIDAYDGLKAFKAPGRPWLPEYIEVMISPYEKAPDGSIKWPADFPGLKDARTIGRGDDQMSIFVPSSRYDELRAFLKHQNEHGAVEIGGRNWSPSLRLPFPQEQLWMAPNPESKKPIR